MAIALGNIRLDFVTTCILKVSINIRPVRATWVNEPKEQQSVFDWVNTGITQSIIDQRPNT